MLALDPHMPSWDLFRWERVWWFGDDGVIFECDDAFDSRFRGGSRGPVDNNSLISVPSPSTRSLSHKRLLHQHSTRTYQNVTTIPLFSPPAGSRMSTRTQSFFVVRSASPFSSGNMDAPVTVIQVTPCVCQNASMGR